MEIWKDVPGYEGRYKVSNAGRIKRMFLYNKPCPKTKQLIKPTEIKYGLGRGYLYLGLNDGAKIKTYGVHRLVAMAFIPNPDGKPETNHKDYNRSNNTVGNLEWVTKSENQKHSGRNPNRKKPDHQRTKGADTEFFWNQPKAA